MVSLRRKALVVLVGLLAGGWSGLLTAVAGEEKTLIEWRFDRDKDLRGWQTHGQIADAAVRKGGLGGRATGSDPILMGPVFEIPAGPLQYFEISIKATADAPAELYWTETLEGRFGGFDPDKHRLFHVKGDGQSHVYRIWPFWHAAKKIIRLRVDPPNAGEFEIQWMRIVEAAREGAKGDSPVVATRKPGQSPATWQQEELRTLWRPSGDVAGGEREPILLSPLVSLRADESAFVCVRMATERAGSGRLYCVSRGQFGWESVAFALRADGRLHSCNIDCATLKNWRDEIILLGLQVPADEAAKTRVESVEVAAEPRGPAELEVSYFGASEGINRAGRPAAVTCTLRNLGGQLAANVVAALEVPEGVKVLDQAEKKIDRLSLYLPKSVSWKVESAALGRIKLGVKAAAAGVEPVSAAASLELTKAPDVPKSAYVPEPRPVKSKYEIGVFYFPGWDSSERWRPILDYPCRKPILGWYDESNPECADWQIKWAVEHGVNFFMVDWYWCQGNRHLEHWLHSAYAKAKYRKYLKWAIMWANHNPPNTHSLEDWRKVTQYWIDHYFHMPEYYRIDNRPAVFIWAPHNVRNDLGGSEAAAKLYAMSQQMAKAAGYPGIYFLAMSSHDTTERCQELKREGYEGLTQYHGFQLAWQRAGSDRFPFAALLDTCPELWRQQDERAKGLLSIPIVDTGWDARPWHGEKSLVAYGRTPELFGKLCRLARAHADKTGNRIIAIGPCNEWGEGSYIEPYAQYGFEDLDQLRAAFCDSGDWPPNVIPADVGLGPYDLPQAAAKSAWEFNTAGAREGWSANGDVAQLEVQEGCLSGRSTGRDPLVQVAGLRVEAEQLRRLRLRMRSDAPGRMQVFWASASAGMSEQTSLGIEISGDGEFHEYELDLGASPRWRGVITSLRLDPASQAGVRFALDYLRLE